MTRARRLPRSHDEAARWHAARLERAQERLREVKRLEHHPHQQHAIALTMARGCRMAAWREQRDWWLSNARDRLARATALRKGLVQP